MIKRATGELRDFAKAGHALIDLQMVDTNVDSMVALIIGPEGTPYHGGAFVFVISLPPTYPFAPPAMKLLTTNDGRTRFNPNLYSNGKVCLSYLGTFDGPSWTCGMKLEGLLMAVQSLLAEDPYHNEPKFEACILGHASPSPLGDNCVSCNAKLIEALRRSITQGFVAPKENCCFYTAKLRHETLRIAVIDVVCQLLWGARAAVADLSLPEMEAKVLELIRGPAPTAEEHATFAADAVRAGGLWRPMRCQWQDRVLRYFASFADAWAAECMQWSAAAPRGMAFPMTAFESPENGAAGTFDFEALGRCIAALKAPVAARIAASSGGPCAAA